MGGNMQGLEGRAVLVTGASGGIGGSVVRQLVTAGAVVYAGARSHAALEKIVAATGAIHTPFDIEHESSIAEAVDGLSLWGLVNCAGWGGTVASPWEVDADVFDKLIAVN